MGRFVELRSESEGDVCGAFQFIKPFFAQGYYPSSLAVLSDDLLREEWQNWKLKFVAASATTTQQDEHRTSSDINLLHAQLASLVEHRDHLNQSILVLTSREFLTLSAHEEVKLPWLAIMVIAAANEERTIQQLMFDRGFIKIGRVEVVGNAAYCFIASAAVMKIEALPTSLGGFIAMSSLGSNGRFANQLFQYAYIRLYALRNGLTAAVPNWEGTSLFGLKDPPPPEGRLNEVRCAPFSYDERQLWELEEPPADIDIWGYCQELPASWRLHKPLLQRLFSLSAERKARLDDWYDTATRGGFCTLVAVHVRRGDCREFDPDLNPWFRLSPVEWYIDLLRSIWPTLRCPILYVATDEPDIASQFHEFPSISADAKLLATIPNYIVDFEILRRADILALCNSSFSRMAALLASSQQVCYFCDYRKMRFSRYDPWSDRNFWQRFS